MLRGNGHHACVESVPTFSEQICCLKSTLPQPVKDKCGQCLLSDLISSEESDYENDTIAFAMAVTKGC